MATYDEYIDQNFKQASPKVIDFMHSRKEMDTQKFIENYSSICFASKSDLKKMWRTERNDYASYVAVALGWHDWFCKETALIGRTEKYGSMIAHIVREIPELGVDTKVFFSQRYGNGYVDCFGIDTIEEKVENGAKPYGYYVRVNPTEDVRNGVCKFYVYRGDRGIGADYECNLFRDVIAFIKKDFKLWKAGYDTKQYGGLDCTPDVTIGTDFDASLKVRTVKA